MTRTNAREIAVRLCFEISENPTDAAELLDATFEPEYYATLAGEDELFSQLPDAKQMEYIRRLVKGVGEHSPELDGYVEKYARGWRFDRLSRMALAIIKASMFEMMYMPDVPNGVSINEAVELTKRYEEPDMAAYVNGVLGSFSREELPE
ncbi:MAG: transcription antitermination factor NusB [Oscillospiraceae bacterium]|nr:transcription antitermination factor NusB [Oscillospiraceae bacterium]